MPFSTTAAAADRYPLLPRSGRARGLSIGIAIFLISSAAGLGALRSSRPTMAGGCRTQSSLAELRRGRKWWAQPLSACVKSASSPDSWSRQQHLQSRTRLVRVGSKVEGGRWVVDDVAQAPTG